MTNEEAIKILRDTPIDIRSTREDDILTLYATAHNMAIEALSAEAEQVTGKLNKRDDSLLKSDSDECKEQKSKLDLISREEVLQMIIVAGECEPDLGYAHLYSVIESLPSVETPTVSEKHQLSEETPTNTPTDLISRQDAVNEIHKYFVEEIDKTPTEIDEDGDELYADMPTVNSLLACNKELSKRIKSLSSAPDSRQRGEWVWKDRHIKRTRQVKGITADAEETVVSVHEDYIEQRPYCSECGKWNDSDHLSYCPNCGADMRGEEHE